MNCLVTAGPTHEPLDAVRRLTNFSTGQLGSQLASFLAERGHTVTLLLGQAATWTKPSRAHHVMPFTTTEDLQRRLHILAQSPMDAIFHAAAVSDFGFGKIYERAADGTLTETKAGKVSTRQGTLLAELVPTPKILQELRNWFPQACLVGWKYEVDGDQTDAIAKASQQLIECRTNACVANGPAYGAGFGLVMTAAAPKHFPDAPALFLALEQLVH